jgi:3-hydroxybutyryl-CoA dehydrogenase
VLRKVLGLWRLIVPTIAVIGATATGCAFAAAAAGAGYTVVLEDVSREARDRGVTAIANLLQERRAVGSLSKDAAEAARNISTASTVEDAIRDAELIIEAVPEELEMKLELFTIFDKFAKPNAIFISTAKTLSILDISDVTIRRDRCIGMRFARAESTEQTLELVPTSLTSPATLQICQEVAQRLARNVRIVPDADPAV